MANNRLYIEDTETGHAVLLAKGWGDGWSVWAEEDVLVRFLNVHDCDGARGGKSSLRLVTEDDPRHADIGELARGWRENLSPAPAPRLDDDDHLVLSTGKRVYCFGGTMCPTGDGGLRYGADGHVVSAEFTSAERREIAAYFIARWRRWQEGP